MVISLLSDKSRKVVAIKVDAPAVAKVVVVVVAETDKVDMVAVDVEMEAITQEEVVVAPEVVVTLATLLIAIIRTKNGRTSPVTNSRKFEICATKETVNVA